MVSSVVFYALVGMIGWGLSNAAAKKLIEHFGPIRTIIFRNAVAIIVLIAVLFFIGFPSTISLWSLVFGIALSIAGYFPYFFFLKGLKRGKVGIIYAVSKGWVIIASAIGFIFLGDIFTLPKVTALAVIIAGVVFASINLRDIKNSDLISVRSGIPYALVAALLWGVVFAFFKFPSAALGGVFFALIVEGCVFLSALTHLTLKRNPLIERGDITTLQKLTPYVLLSGCGAGLGTSFINLGYATGEIAIVSAIAGAAVLVAALFAARFYGERLTVKQYAGIAIVFTGIALAALLT